MDTTAPIVDTAPNINLMSNQAIDSPKKKGKTFLKFLFVGIIISGICSITGYQLGLKNGTVSKNNNQQIKKNIPKILPKSENVAPTTETTTTPYTVTYTIPSGWRTTLWHPTQNSTASAILSPDYTSLQNDTSPQTGIAIVIYRFPGTFNTIEQLRAKTEETEDGLQKITATTIGGIPAYHAIFVSTDSDRILDDYHILKNTDQWVIRLILHGNSLSDAQNEEQLYNTQINTFLQSIQFQ